ncbi:tail fiber protein [Bradyrhizobium sp. Pear77]|uniref:phage tail protein n=1 Tax=Bradyrhizobium altum TaxID=1571202 RepID=UPI001E448410|nr:tail fiber protein [Bradyrhizobium altum]MCC8954102.1 tail fiber protein [Bradyrhizobium altum]
MPWWRWSKTANLNSNSDPVIGWAEGQAPSSINDSARAMMAETAKYRDDIAGLIVTAGTSTAYTLATSSVFDSFPHMDGAMIAFTPHVTNGQGPVSLNVDGIGAQPLRTAPATELVGGTLIAGTPYVATYKNADNAWYLQGFYGNPYNVPLGASLEYWSLVAPNSSFAFVTGQAISRTTYSALFNLIGTLYGAGDGTTTFNLPNKTGRVGVMRDPGQTQIGTGVFSSVDLGGVGGAQTHAIAQANLPAVNFPVSNGALSVLSTVADIVRSTFGTTSSTASTGGALGMFASSSGNQTQQINSTGTVSGQTAASGGSGTPLITVQPSIVCNTIMRII